MFLCLDWGKISTKTVEGLLAGPIRLALQWRYGMKIYQRWGRIARHIRNYFVWSNGTACGRCFRKSDIKGSKAVTRITANRVPS